MTALAPLDDPSYVPRHPPLHGIVPAVVALWGARSQRRWFRRYLWTGALRPGQPWERWHVHSTQHLGPCCGSCLDDQEEGYEPLDALRCCCRHERPPLLDRMGLPL